MSRIKVSTSPYATVSTANVTMFIEPYATAISSTGWAFDSASGNLYSPLIDGEILKVVCDYTSGASTSVWTLKTRDTPTEEILLVTGTDADETINPRVACKDNTGASLQSIGYNVTFTAAAGMTIVSTATWYAKYAVHGSLLCSCSGLAGESLITRIYYR